MILAVFLVIFGSALLAYGADRFVLGASACAKNLGVSSLVIGMALVGFATSFPEMLVSAMAAWQGNPEVGIGNAIGSNIANIGLVLGVSALVSPLIMESKLLRREFPMLIVIMLLVLVLLINQYLSRLDGVLLFSGFIAVLVWMTFQAIRTRQQPQQDALAREFKAEIPRHMPMRKAVAWLTFGLLALLVSSRMLVIGAVSIARHFGVSELVIGLTIVAIGTSLPELAASVASVMRKEHDIAIGNVIGSNMFNLLAVLAMPALISPGPISRWVLLRDYPIMMAYTLILLLMASGYLGKSGRMSRLEGGVLLMGYLLYLFYLF